MQEIVMVLALALLPAAGNIAGGLLAEFLRPSQRVLNIALHAAAGIIVAVVAVEVMPEVLPVLNAGTLAIAFIAGGAAYIGVESAVQAWERREAGRVAGPWMVYIAVAADLFGDGLLIGSGSAVATRMAVLLALGQVLADVPEGFATNALFRAGGATRARRLWISASFVAPILFAAVVSFFLLKDAPTSLQMAALVFVSGLYTVAAVEEILEQAHDAGADTHFSALAFVTGFALFAVVSKVFASTLAG